ncbi:uncharacterized protein LOC144437765 [Glandiceps talaboti]
MDHKRVVPILLTLSLSIVGSSGDYGSTFLFSGICWHNIKYPLGRVFTEDVEGSGYPRGENCKVTIISPDERYRILIVFESFNVYYSEGCTLDYVQIYDGYEISDDELLTEKPLCGDVTPSAYHSTGKVITLQFVTSKELPVGRESDGIRKPNGFTFVYNAFIPFHLIKDDVNNTMGLPSQFCCKTGDVCIDWALVCDDVINCPDYSDETETLRCLAKKTGLEGVAESLGLPMKAVVGVVVGSILLLILIIIIVVICCCCRRRRRRRHRRDTKDVEELYRHPNKMYVGSKHKSKSSKIVHPHAQYLHSRLGHDIVRTHYSGMTGTDQNGMDTTPINSDNMIPYWPRSPVVLRSPGRAHRLHRPSPDIYKRSKEKTSLKRNSSHKIVNTVFQNHHHSSDYELTSNPSTFDKRPHPNKDNFDFECTSTMPSRHFEAVYYRLYPQNESHM